MLVGRGGGGAQEALVGRGVRVETVDGGAIWTNVC